MCVEVQLLQLQAGLQLQLHIQLQLLLVARSFAYSRDEEGA